MFRREVFLLFLLMLGLATNCFGAAKLTIFSTLKADLYVNDQKQVSINNSDPFILELKEPGKYVIELKAVDKKLNYTEEVNLISGTDFEKTIRAFENVKPGEEAVKKTENTPDKEVKGVTRAEMKAEVAKAKAEALAEEEARRKREKEREAGKKALMHVIGVETQDVDSDVKNMERIKLLGEVLPEIGD